MEKRVTVQRIPITIREQWLERFEPKFIREPTSGCWLWIGARVPDGYGSFYTVEPYSMKAHRVAWLLYRGDIPENQQVLHKCDVRCCVNPDHLFLGDNDANVADRVSKNRSARNWGQKSPTCKLTAEQAKAILEDKRPHKEIAADYGVSTGPIQAIKTGKGWRHILEVTDKRGHLRGDACSFAKLTSSDIRAIRASGQSQSALAKQYGVSQTLIGKVKRRVVWRDVD